jgi:hypothetical protein
MHAPDRLRDLISRAPCRRNTPSSTSGTTFEYSFVRMRRLRPARKLLPGGAMRSSKRLHLGNRPACLARARQPLVVILPPKTETPGQRLPRHRAVA